VRSPRTVVLGSRFSLSLVSSPSSGRSSRRSTGQSRTGTLAAIEGHRTGQTLHRPLAVVSLHRGAPTTVSRMSSPRASAPPGVHPPEPRAPRRRARRRSSSPEAQPHHRFHHSVIGIGRAKITIGGVEFYEMPLATYVGSLLNLILPRGQAAASKTPVEPARLARQGRAGSLAPEAWVAVVQDGAPPAWGSSTVGEGSSSGAPSGVVGDAPTVRAQLGSSASATAHGPADSGSLPAFTG
jgi:hypothetical protein